MAQAVSASSVPGWNIVEMKGNQPRLDAGEDFLDNVMLRLNQHAPRQPVISGYIRNHATPVLLALLVAINVVSIGLGIGSYLSDKDIEMSQENAEMVYFIDSEQYQVYSYIKE